MPKVIRRKRSIHETLKAHMDMRPPVRLKRDLTSFLNLVRLHWLDWTVLAVLAVLGFVVWAFVPTFQRRVSQDQLVHLSYPVVPNTVSSAYLPVLSLALPLLVFLISFFCERKVDELHRASLGLLHAVVLTWLLTDALKKCVGRPRPNFLKFCFPDGEYKFDGSGGVVCSAAFSQMQESCQSFPSGHASYTFAGMTYLALYLASKVNLFSHPPQFLKLALILIPFTVATFVATSRVSDYKHHWEDVVAGSLLGVVFAVTCYFQLFPFSVQVADSSNLSQEASREIPVQRMVNGNECVPAPVSPSVSISQSPATILRLASYPRLSRSRTAKSEVEFEEIVPMTSLPMETHPHGLFDDALYPKSSTVPSHPDVRDTRDTRGLSSSGLPNDSMSGRDEGDDGRRMGHTAATSTKEGSVGPLSDVTPFPQKSNTFSVPPGGGDEDESEDTLLRTTSF